MKTATQRKPKAVEPLPRKRRPKLVEVSKPEEPPDDAGVFWEHSMSKFFEREGRWPWITDERKPWTYRGWALPYVMGLHAHPCFGKAMDAKLRESLDAMVSLQKGTKKNPAKPLYVTGSCPDRWGYHLRTVEAGKLLDEGIPQISLTDGFDRSAGHKAIDKWETIASYDGGAWSSFNMLVDWLAFALGVCKEKPNTNEKCNEALYREVNFEILLANPSDYLGEYLASRKAGGWNPNAFFPTPHAICEMMVRMTMDHDFGKDQRLATVCDPTVGSGRMLLHASNYSLRLYGVDIDRLVLKICQINGALYAPWMVFPLPTSIRDADSPTLSHGDVLAPDEKYQKLRAKIPPPPPAPLQANQPKEAKRVDDRSQGRLF